MEVKLNLFKPSALVFFALILAVLSGLNGCASSSIERNAASNVDSAYQSSNYALTHAADNSTVNAFQNAPQTGKGVLIGTTSGAVIGGFSSGVPGILPFAVGGAIVGGVIGAWIDYHTNLIDRLENRGVKVYVLGDQLMLILPSSWVFEGRTPRIQPQSKSTLDMVAEFIRQYPTMSVKVAAYTNDVGNNEINCYITQQQADTVVKYLWPRVDTRVLFAQGYGGTHLIAPNNLNWAEGENYRLEITFEKLPV
jgi:outer membrane protein OmpA-like peptidoglycan-associated protein